MKKAYADFHDKGLEIVGVSNDRKAEDLTKFLAADPQMPWPQLFNAEAAAKSTWNPLTLNLGIDGIPVTELSADQKTNLQRVLRLLLEPYRQSDRDEAVAALKRQGGLDRCFLSFYRRDDLGNDGVWDNWRLEGPAFVWHYRGAPHVHVWVNVAADPRVTLNARNLSGALRQ